MRCPVVAIQQSAGPKAIRIAASHGFPSAPSGVCRMGGPWYELRAWPPSPLFITRAAEGARVFLRLFEAVIVTSGRFAVTKRIQRCSDELGRLHYRGGLGPRQ